MDLLSIDFKDGLPNKVTVQIDIKEAVWIALVAGKQRGQSPHNQIWDCLIGDVFNRYWEDGICEANIEAGGIQIPPIKYEETP